MIANSPAAVAAAFSSSSSPVFPGDSRWAAMPEPTTTAARNPLPRNSAATRRHNVTGALLTAPILTDPISSVKIESMKAELIPGVDRRAAVHAALADPARLHIIDTLGAGDTSPSELAAMLAMPSNLLAHHLHVLEQAGLLTRRRSDGDRRRTYLQLIPGALESLTRPAARTAGRVLFVCTANSARSHLAAALWRRASTVPAASQAPSPPRGSTRAPSPPPGATACRCAACGPATSATSGKTATSSSPCATWPARNWAARQRCTGPSPTRSRPAIPPASTRRSPSSVTASSASHRAWQRPPADLRSTLAAGCARRPRTPVIGSIRTPAPWAAWVTAGPRG